MSVTSRAPKSSQWRRARQRGGNDPYSAASRRVGCVRSLTAWNVALMCGCRSVNRVSYLKPNKRSIIIILSNQSHLDAVFPTCTDHLPTVKLQRRHAMLVLDRLQNPSSAEVPDLIRKTRGVDFGEKKGKKTGRSRTRTDLSKLPLTT
jgi:hypothetical protein